MNDAGRSRSPRARAYFASGLLVVAIAALAGRLFFIQILRHDRYAEKALRQVSSLRDVEIPRGDILDVNGAKVALTIVPPESPSELGFDFHLLTKLPRDLSTRTLLDLVCLLDMPRKDAAALLGSAFEREETNPKFCQWLRVEDKVPPAVTPLVGAYLRAAGEARGVTWRSAVKLQKRPVRRHTFADPRDKDELYYRMYEEVLGRVADNGAGIYGVEGGFDQLLRGRNGMQEIHAGPDGTLRHLEPGGIGINPVEPCDLYITIDTRLQKIVWDAVHEGFDDLREGTGPHTTETNALKVSALVLDPHTGRILAFATWPQPEEAAQLFGDYPIESLRVWLKAAPCVPIFGLYEPGSVFKCFIAAKILQDHLSSVPGHVVWEGGTSRSVPGRRSPVTDTHQVKVGSLATGFIQSSNIVFSIMAEKLGSRRLQELLREFGLAVDSRDKNDRDPAVILQLWPREAKAPFVSPQVPWHIPPQDVTSMGFGAAVSVTMLSLARGYSVLVNGGYLVEPHIHYSYVPHGMVRGMRYFQPGAPRRVIRDEETLTNMRNLLISVVEDRLGTGHRLRGREEPPGSGRWRNVLIPPGLTIGAKTGTAKRYVSDAGGYNSRFYTGTFICHAPAENPRYVVVTRVDVDREWPDKKNRGLGKYYGGDTAAPVAASILSALFRESPE